MKKKNRKKSRIKDNMHKIKVEEKVEEEQSKKSDTDRRKTKKKKNKPPKPPLTQEQIIKRKKKRIICLVVVIVIFIILLIKFCTSLYKWNKLIKDIINVENSVILDSSGNVVAVLGETRIQQTVGLDKIPQKLINAYVAIEDKNFYKHHGISIKRTVGAIGSYITHGSDGSYGGSTITQQLVKNITGENETSISRKVTEWNRAIMTEMILSKDQIMQTYLNIIYVGPNIYGVEMGAKYYFNKSVSELDLAECAFLAGINNSPNSYNPFREQDNSSKIKTRTTTVLNVMLEQKYITKEEYNQAKDELEKGLKFEKGDVQPKGDGVYSYMADATISEVLADLQSEKKISASFATNYLYMGGLKIYGTQNSDIQGKVEEEFSKNKYMIKSSEVEGATSQAAMVVIDHETGYVMGCVGGLGEKNTARGFNRATQALRQTGSAIKPIAILGPALEEKIITPVTIYDDTRTTFADGYNPEDCEDELGQITVRRAVESSQNIPFVKMLEQLTPKKAIKYMKNSGITTLTDGDCNLPLALGGLEKGISPLEMAGAYATIANGGKYIEPVFYTKIENKNGKIILQNKQKSKKVYSEDTAYILKKLLTQPVNGENGTAKSCKIDGFEVAAKTGTTNDNYDKWLCGFTKYYTAVTWFGFDFNESIKEGADSMANHIWTETMTKIHENYIEAVFDKPDSVQEAVICRDTGKRANGNCKNTYIEYFRKGTVIQERCDKH